MTYATQAEMTTRFGVTELAQLTDRADGSVIDAAVLAVALADADALINGYVQSRYALPLATVPQVLVRWACDIARYTLYEDGAPEVVQKRYDAALAQLRDVAAGRIDLADDATAPPAPVSGGVQSSTRARIFGRSGGVL